MDYFIVYFYSDASVLYIAEKSYLAFFPLIFI